MANWMADAFKNAGKPGRSLRVALKVRKGKNIPAAKIAKAAQSSNPRLAKQANLARTAAKIRRGK